MIDEVSYWIDEDNRIAKVSPSWDSFALENDGRETLAERVLGRDLLQFVRGDEVRMLLLVILGRARVLDKEACLRYRCDSPDVRRFMEMKVRPVGGGGLLLEHRVVAREPTRPVAFAAGVVEANATVPDLLSRCSMCNRVNPQGQWTEPDAAAANGHLGSARPIRVVYTVCEACRELVRSSLAD